MQEKKSNLIAQFIESVKGFKQLHCISNVKFNFRCLEERVVLNTNISVKRFTVKQGAFVVSFLHTVIEILGAIRYNICCYSL